MEEDTTTQTHTTPPLIGGAGRGAALVVCLIFFLGLAIDQAIKIWVKTSFTLHESLHITDWFQLVFIENNGMAFGMELFDKIFLTGFRLVATLALAVYISRQIKKGVRWAYLICLSFIMTGAAGNIIDCVLYGQIFSQSTPFTPAELVPIGQGAGEWFYGKVVDMFYFPLAEWTWPDWLPIIGGSHYLFFSYIFNFADACITCGVIALILFCRKELSSEMNNKKLDENEQ
ncbi:MAG: lipoprotein signal peptidase [Bacteroidaceae bacterium]|nr:lipoprotein signal peptidase [Bacteroidaceae bacterium]